MSPRCCFGEVRIIWMKRTSNSLGTHRPFVVFSSTYDWDDLRAERKGHGRTLLQWAEDTARRAGLSRIRLCTQEVMTENIAIHTRRGYVETHRATEIGLKRILMQKLFR